MTKLTIKSDILVTLLTPAHAVVTVIKLTL